MLIVGAVLTIVTAVFFIVTLSTYNAESKVGYLNNFWPGAFFTGCSALGAVIAFALHFL